MPVPVSVTLQRRNSVPGRRRALTACASSSVTTSLRMVSVPPCGMASCALTHRLSSTCVARVASIDTFTGSGAGLSLSVVRPRRMRFARSAASFKTRLKSSTVTFSSQGRLKDRSCCERFEARAAAWSACSSRVRDDSGSAESISSKPTLPRMARRRLLKSCATPAASAPSVWSFCASNNWF